MVEEIKGDRHLPIDDGGTPLLAGMEGFNNESLIYNTSTQLGLSDFDYLCNKTSQGNETITR
ncbi:hypothetical protein J6590_089575 [Homalodisca vitripennis]|nr:hypothetical protein J6590_089575 [Homalodisca vitripennis]